MIGEGIGGERGIIVELALGGEMVAYAGDGGGEGGGHGR